MLIPQKRSCAAHLNMKMTDKNMKLLEGIGKNNYRRTLYSLNLLENENRIDIYKRF